MKVPNEIFSRKHTILHDQSEKKAYVLVEITDKNPFLSLEFEKENGLRS